MTFEVGSIFYRCEDHFKRLRIFVGRPTYSEKNEHGWDFKDPKVWMTVDILSGHKLIMSERYLEAEYEQLV